MTEKERNDCLGKEVGYGAVKHPAEGADSIMEHTVQIAFPCPDKVALQCRGVGVAETYCVAIVCPYVVEHTLDGRARNVESELSEHGRQDMPSKGRLDHIGSIETIDTADISASAGRETHLVLNTPFCSRIESPWRVHK